MINKQYVQNSEQIKAAFNKNSDLPHVVLFDFFEKEFYEKLKEKLLSIKLSHEKKPLTHSYSSVKTTALLTELFEFISTVINSKINPTQTLFQFDHNDYTILNDNETQEESYDIIFDITENWNDEAGGHIHYVDGTGEYTKMPIKENTLIIVKRTASIQSFVKYVNNLASGQRRFVLVSGR